MTDGPTTPGLGPLFNSEIPAKKELNDDEVLEAIQKMNNRLEQAMATE